MDNKKTNRGFDLLEFTDRYGCKCSLQKSSLAFEDCIWFGVNDADPKIMANIAKSYGVETDQTTGWVTYPVPSEVLLNTRMHLTQDMVKELLPALQRFVDTGEIQ